jgi:hypothetical protein
VAAAVEDENTLVLEGSVGELSLTCVSRKVTLAHIVALNKDVVGYQERVLRDTG